MQSDIRNKIFNLKLALVVLVETKVKQSSYNYIANSVMPNGWRETSNIEDNYSVRIWMMWDPRLVHVTVSFRDAQIMHCKVKYENVDFLYLVCYGFNIYLQRRDL